MTATWCPRCGTTWDQRGNQTGHCSGCSRTFASLRAFDAHQRIRDGESVCLDPATLCHGTTGEPLWMTVVDRFGTKVWRSVKTWDGPHPKRARSDSVANDLGGTNA